MPQNDLVKVCPRGHKNHHDAELCTECGRRLENVPPVPHIPPGEPWIYRLVRYFSSAPKKRWFVLSTLGLVTAIVLSSVMIVVVPRIFPKGASNYPGPLPTKITTHLQLPAGLGEVQIANDQYIGVNDGSFAPFDIGRSTQTLKQRAAGALKGGNSSAAVSLWQQALTIGSNDAEALIYIEDQRVLASGEPYITLIAGVAFTFSTTLLVADGSSESDLQGVYVAQHEFNAAHPNLKVRVFIANAGSNESDATDIAQQIVHIVQHDPTVVGVIGWRYSAYSLQAIPVLAKAKIPLISSQSTSDTLTGISPYFFRVVAPNKAEAQIAAQLIKNPPSSLAILHTMRPVIFVDPSDPYSQTLTQDIEMDLRGYTTWHEEQFATNDKDSQEKFSQLIKDSDKYKPDIFLFTSRSNGDTASFEKALPNEQNVLPNESYLARIPILAGSASYNAETNILSRWYLIAVAYHNEDTAIAKKFAQDYIADFNTYAHKTGGFYGDTLADDHAIVAYDATAVTLKAIDTVYKSGMTPQDLASELPKIAGANAFQGVSGQISFGSDGDPINKTLVILSVSKDGFQLQSI